MGDVRFPTCQFCFDELVFRKGPDWVPLLCPSCKAQYDRVTRQFIGYSRYPYRPGAREQPPTAYVAAPSRTPEDPLVPVQNFDAWVKRLGFAGMAGAVHYTLVDGEWRDTRMIRAQAIMDKAGCGYIIKQDGERFSAWVQHV